MTSFLCSNTTSPLNMHGRDEHGHTSGVVSGVVILGIHINKESHCQELKSQAAWRGWMEKLKDEVKSQESRVKSRVTKQ